MTYVSTLPDLPSEPHWAIIKTVSVHIPGDERSRTNPGHGYPEHTEQYITYEMYRNLKEWEDQVRVLTLRGDRFRAIKAIPASVEIEVKVS